MDRCYLLVDVQEIRIQPYFCVKQGDYFFFTFSGTPCMYTLKLFAFIEEALSKFSYFREKVSEILFH